MEKAIQEARTATLKALQQKVPTVRHLLPTDEDRKILDEVMTLLSRLNEQQSRYALAVDMLLTLAVGLAAVSPRIADAAVASIQRVTNIAMFEAYKEELAKANQMIGGTIH